MAERPEEDKPIETPNKSNDKENAKQKEDSSIKKLYKQHIGNDFLIRTLIFLLFFIIFHKFFENLITNSIVKYIASSISKPDFIVDVGVVVTIVCLIYLAFKAPEKLKTSIKTTIVLLLILVVYVVYRFTPIWTFTSFSICEYIYYIDVFILFVLINIYVGSKVNKEAGLTEQENRGFIADEPINQANDDLFNYYGSYAEKITDVIKKTYHEKAFTIGINAEWGSGKTSLFHLFRRELEKDKDKFVLIDFNPWESNTASQIIPDFFKKLDGQINNNDTLYHKINSYAEKISAIEKNSVTSLFSLISSFNTKSKTSKDLQTEIGQTLKAQNKRMVIFIDDIDRLDESELSQVLKLIRNTGNFSRVIFILAYDRNYVENLIKRKKDYNQHRFLEKIVQAEFSLPTIAKKAIKIQLCNDLELLINSIESDSISADDKQLHVKIMRETIIEDNSLLHKKVNPWIRNLRDSKRLVNSMKVSLPKLLGEVLFKDYFYLEVLKLNYPFAYQLLQHNYDEVLELKGKAENIFHLKKYNNNKQSKEKKLSIVEFLDKKYNETEISRIIELLNTIFTGITIHDGRDNKKLSVRLGKNRMIYFSYDLAGDFSVVRFYKMLNQPFEEMKDEVSLMISEGFVNEVYFQFDYLYFSDVENSEKLLNVVSSIIYFADHIRNNEQVDYGWFYKEFKLLDSCFTAINYIEERFYPNNIEKYKSSITEIIKSKADLPFLFLRGYIYDLREKQASQSESYLDKTNSKYLFTIEELEEVNYFYLKNYLQHQPQFGQDLTYIFLNCKRILNNQNTGQLINEVDTSLYIKDSIEIFKSFVIENDIEGLLVLMLDIDRNVSERPYKIDTSKYRLNGFAKDLFDNVEVFILEKALNDIQFIADYRSFVKFYVNHENGDFDKTIQYSFSDDFVIWLVETKKRYFTTSGTLYQ